MCFYSHETESRHEKHVHDASRQDTCTETPSLGNSTNFRTRVTGVWSGSENVGLCLYSRYEISVRLTSSSVRGSPIAAWTLFSLSRWPWALVVIHPGLVSMNGVRNTHTHTHTNTHPFNGPFSGTTRVSQYQKGKPIWILLKQETVSGSCISWAICKSAPRSRQITTPAPHHSVFYRPDALPVAQPTASKH